MGKQGPLWVLGTMSGTSLDGVDAAMLRTDGHQILEFGPDAYRPYSEAERSLIRAAFGKWPGEAGVAALRNEVLPTLDEAERVHILKALELTDGHKGKACQMLGISRPTLERKLKKYRAAG